MLRACGLLVYSLSIVGGKQTQLLPSCCRFNIGLFKKCGFVNSLLTRYARPYAQKSYSIISSNMLVFPFLHRDYYKNYYLINTGVLI